MGASAVRRAHWSKGPRTPHPTPPNTPRNPPHTPPNDPPLTHPPPPPPTPTHPHPPSYPSPSHALSRRAKQRQAALARRRRRREGRARWLRLRGAQLYSTPTHVRNQGHTRNAHWGVAQVDRRPLTPPPKPTHVTHILSPYYPSITPHLTLPPNPPALPPSNPPPTPKVARRRLRHRQAAIECAAGRRLRAAPSRARRGVVDLPLFSFGPGPVFTFSDFAEPVLPCITAMRIPT